jgi:Family of unknown function (DUF6519)
MSFDTSRFTFDPWKDYSGVVMEQGRVQTDADWNEWLSELSRRVRAGTLDTMGHAVYPQTTPNAFKIDASTSGSTNVIRIGLGRMYVDGILVENHGAFANATWDPALAELSNVPQPQPATPQTLDGTNSILFQDQPYNLGATVPAGPGQYVAYLDVWQRPITYIEDSSLIDVAIGVDTTGRMQTAWRVSLLPLPGVAVAGSVTSGKFSSGDLVTQASSGATAIVIGAVPAAGPMILSLVSGTPDATDIWSNTSGAQFTPSAAPADIGSFVAGSVTSGTFQSGEVVVQGSTGASATLSETVPSAGPMILGPISGTPAALAPWVGQTSGAVFTPVSLPSGSVSTIAGAVSSGTFVANEQVVQNSSNASATLIGTVPTSGPMIVGSISGTPDDSDDWVGQSSNATFTPSGAPVPSGWSCSTSDYSLPWPVSSGTLTTQPVSSSQTGPCCLTTGSGYTGPENQFYRIEIHTPGGAGAAGATFKWSRENASVQTAVTAISSASNSLGAPSNALTVQSLGRDQVLGFSAGDWIEITDETHDNNCLPGELYKIDRVTVPDSSIVLTTQLSGNFTTTTLAANAYTRIVRWDQSGQVYKVVAGKQQPYYNLDASPSPGALPNGCGGIPVPTDGSPIVLESGIAISFGLSLASGCMQAMDFWNFTARTADGSIEELTKAPPRGISHHYTKLSIVAFGVSSNPSATDCRTEWPPSSSSDCGCCCTVTVGDGTSSHGQFTSIQNAVTSLKQGGEVCILPGSYYEHVLIEGTRGIRIHGCGPRTRVYSPSLHPGGSGSSPSGASGATVADVPAVFTIVSSAQITLECFSVVAAEGEVGVLMDQAAAPQGNDVELNKRLLVPDSNITISDLDLSASTMPAIAARDISGLTIRDNRIVMKDVASLFPAVYLSGDAIRFERNLVQIASRGNAAVPLPVVAGAAIGKPSTGLGVKVVSESAKATPQVLAVGGVQVAGPANDVWIVENEIEGGTRNGITLGNIIYLDGKGNGDGTLVGVLTETENPCSNGGSSSIPGTTRIGTTPTPVAAGGRIRNLHILRNRIRDVGMCGIGPVGFFDLNTTREIVSLENVLIAENILVNTLTRNVLAAAVAASPYGYGVISLPDVLNLIIRDNIVSNYGVSPGAEVCGIYVYHGEGIEIDSNQIRESRDLSGSRDVKWSNYGGRRAGIYIELATPPTLDTSANSVWTESVKAVYTTDVSDAFRYQPPDYAPGFSALRIENNTVRVAFGLALHAVGTGPFSILGNHFSTGGTVSVDSAALREFDLNSPALADVGTMSGALTVSIVNLGLALEAFDLIESFTNLYAANDTFTSESTNSLAVTNGTVMFSNNICQLMAQLNSARGVSSVAILTLDHLMFTNNQLWINGPRSTSYFDALLFGISVQAVANRLQESTGAVIDSGFSFGVMNVTSQNVSTYCFLSKGLKAQWWIQSPNVAFNYTRCEKG